MDQNPEHPFECHKKCISEYLAKAKRLDKSEAGNACPLSPLPKWIRKSVELSFDWIYYVTNHAMQLKIKK